MRAGMRQSRAKNLFRLYAVKAGENFRRLNNAAGHSNAPGR